MKIWIFCLLLLATALLACETKQNQGAPSSTIQAAAPSVFSVVQGTQAKELVAKGAILLDVRTPGEFAAGHIDGAINIPVQDLGTRLSELDKTKATVVYCASGARSSAAMSQMKEGGFVQVYDLGGRSNW